MEVSTEQCTPHPRGFEGLTVEDFVHFLLMEHSFLLFACDDCCDIYCFFGVLWFNSLILSGFMVFLTNSKWKGLP